MLIGDIQWLSAKTLGGWAIETDAPGKPVDISLRNAVSGEIITQTSSSQASLPSPYGDCAHFEIPIEPDTYRALLRLICDGVRDIGVQISFAGRSRSLIVGHHLYRVLRKAAMAESLVKFDVGPVVSVRDDARVYLRGGTNSNLVHLNATQPLEDDVLRYWVENIEALAASAKAVSANLLVLVVAAKEVVEFAGGDFEVSAARPVYQVFNALSPLARSSFLYNHSALLQGLPHQRKFLSNDTHMNALGAYVTGCSLLERLRVPPSLWPKIEDIGFFVADFKGDLGTNTKSQTHAVALQFHALAPYVSGVGDFETSNRNNIFGLPQTLRIHGHSTAVMLSLLLGQAFSQNSHDGQIIPVSHDIEPNENVVIVIPERYLARARNSKYKGQVYKS
ncbi:MAG TPA: hypothetical protein PK706_12905 [Xanthobacteraceae bacterium]|jgi:hypothetical protein|nr:hypothetical protein [Xanthobacteraceae bacterium]